MWMQIGDGLVDSDLLRKTRRKLNHQPHIDAERRHRVEKSEKFDRRQVFVTQLLPYRHIVVCVAARSIEPNCIGSVSNVFGAQQAATPDHTGNTPSGVGAAREAQQIDPVPGLYCRTISW